MRDILDGNLTILRCVADVLRVRADDPGKLLLEGVDHVSRFVKREGGLSEIGHAIGIWNFEGLHFSGAGNDGGHIRSFPEGAFNLFVVAMADKHERVALPGELDGLDVHLGDERAGGVNDAELALFGLLPDGGRDAMGAIDNAAALGDFIDILDEDGAFFSQFVDHKPVVNDLLAHIDRRAEGLERDADNVNGADYARAESAGFEQENFALGGIASRGIGRVLIGVYGHPISISWSAAFRAFFSIFRVA